LPSFSTAVTHNNTPNQTQRGPTHPNTPQPTPNPTTTQTQPTTHNTTQNHQGGNFAGADASAAAGHTNPGDCGGNDDMDHLESIGGQVKKGGDFPRRPSTDMTAGWSASRPRPAMWTATGREKNIIIGLVGFGTRSHSLVRLGTTEQGPPSNKVTMLSGLGLHQRHQPGGGRPDRYGLYTGAPPPPLDSPRMSHPKGGGGGWGGGYIGVGKDSWISGAPNTQPNPPTPPPGLVNGTPAPNCLSRRSALIRSSFGGRPRNVYHSARSRIVSSSAQKYTKRKPDVGDRGVNGR